MISKIKALQLAARKSGNAVDASLLTTLLGEASMVGKNNGNRETTDAEVIAIVKKFIKNIDETLKVVKDNRADVLNQERQLLEQFLPRQLTVDELTNVIQILILKCSGNMGAIMKALKTDYDGQYDGQRASVLIKELIK